MDALLRRRKVSRLAPGPLGNLDAFIADEEVVGARGGKAVDLPDLADFARQSADRPARRRPEPAAPAGEPPSKAEEVLRGLSEALVPKNPKASDGIFDKGPGLLITYLVYGISIGSVLWEVYLNSPCFTREVPMLSLEQALVGYPIPPPGGGPPVSADPVFGNLVPEGMPK